jgi:hypothetical protein
LEIYLKTQEIKTKGNSLGAERKSKRKTISFASCKAI